MIRKYISLALVGSALITGLAFANSVTTTVNTGSMVNLLSSFNQPITVQQIIIANTDGTNTAVSIIDSPTNLLSYINPAYTNTLSVATNYVSTWTNYYGVSYSTTNIALIDLTNNLVASTTNAYPVRLGVATLANTSSRYDGVNYYFNNGIWATNISSGKAIITVTYH